MIGVLYCLYMLPGLLLLLSLSLCGIAISVWDFPTVQGMC